MIEAHEKGKYQWHQHIQPTKTTKMLQMVNKNKQNKSISVWVAIRIINITVAKISNNHKRATTKKGQQTEKRSHEGNKISRRNNIMS